MNNKSKILGTVYTGELISDVVYKHLFSMIERTNSTSLESLRSLLNNNTSYEEIGEFFLEMGLYTMYTILLQERKILKTFLTHCEECISMMKESQFPRS
jgi:hypothetical protein